MAEVLDALAEADWVTEENVSMRLSEVVDKLDEVNWMKELEVDVLMAEVLDALAELVENRDVSSMTELVWALAKMDIYNYKLSMLESWPWLT